MFGLPLPILLLIVSALAGLAAPLLVGAYHRFVVYVFKKTGVDLPDNAEIDADIVAVLKGLLPELLKEAAARKLDPAALIAAIEAAVHGKVGSAAVQKLDAPGVLAASPVAIPFYDPTKSVAK